MNRDGMNIDALDPHGRLEGVLLGLQSGVPRLLEDPAHGVKEERPRAARRIEDGLHQGRRHHLGDHPRGQPVGGVVFAKAVAMIPVDQRFVEDFQDVALGLAQAEPAYVSRQPADQVGAFRRQEHPVEEIALDRAEHSGVGEGATREDGLRVVGFHLHQPGGDRLGDDDEEGVLQPQIVVFDFPAIDEGEELRPQLTLERRGRMGRDLRPRPREDRFGPQESDALVPELGGDVEGVGVDFRPAGDGAIQPRQQFVAAMGVGLVMAQQERLTAAQLVGFPLRSVSDDADEALAGGPLALGQIATQLLDRVPPLPGEVGFELDDRSPQQGVDPAARLHNANFMADLMQLGPQSFGEQHADLSADRLVPGATGQFGDDLEQALGGERHGRCPTRSPVYSARIGPPNGAAIMAGRRLA
jgi:hypothetical protein